MKKYLIAAAAVAVCSLALAGLFSTGNAQPVKAAAPTMPPLMGGGATMAVGGGGLYVLTGGIVYRLDAETLAVLAKGKLPAPGQ